MTSQNEKTTLLGKTKKDYANILRWMSFSNSEALPAIAGWFRPLTGRDPFNKKSVEDHKTQALKCLKVLDDHFLVNTYFVGERLTLADLYVASQIYRGFQNVLDKKFREENPNISRWYETVYHQPIYSDVAPKFEWCEEAVKYQPPKKEAPKKQEAPKKETPKKKAVEEDDEEEDKPAPKPKHPLEALDRPTFVLDDWKRKYSNEETREVALPWFWENMNFNEYSIWRVEYKYNDELTMTFMTSNLIGEVYQYVDLSENTNSNQAASSPVSRRAASTSSVLAPSTESPMTLSCAVHSSSAARRRFQPSKSLPTTRATSSSSSTRKRRKTGPLSMTCGLGTSRSRSMARATSGQMARSSSKPAALCSWGCMICELDWCNVTFDVR